MRWSWRSCFRPALRQPTARWRSPPMRCRTASPTGSSATFPPRPRRRRRSTPAAGCRTRSRPSRAAASSALFTDRCFAIALVPQAGATTLAWAIEADRQAAQRKALAGCAGAAGDGADQCRIVQSRCDGSTWADQCGGRNGAAPEARIAGCTALIGSGDESAADLVSDYVNRGNAHADRQDFDQAIADYGEALGAQPDARGRLVRPRQRLADEGRLRQGDRRLRPGDRARSPLRGRLRQPRRRLCRQGRCRPRHLGVHHRADARRRRRRRPTAIAPTPTSTKAISPSRGRTTTRRSGGRPAMRTPIAAAAICISTPASSRRPRLILPASSRRSLTTSTRCCGAIWRRRGPAWRAAMAGSSEPQRPRAPTGPRR